MSASSSTTIRPPVNIRQHEATASTQHSYQYARQAASQLISDVITDPSPTTNSTQTFSATSSAAQPTMINAPAQIGLIMPNPGSNVYTGVEYRMGYVDPGPAPRVNGALRVITPLLTYPNYTTDVFPETGSLDADPVNHTDTVGWCSVNLAAAPYTFPFRFDKSGWHQFVINTTWGRPTITGDDLSTNCSFPITQQYTFYGTRAVSVAPSPTTGGLIKAAPAYTVWVDLTWRAPGALPLDTHKDTTETKVVVGMSIAGAFVAIGTIIAIMWLIRRRRKAEREALAISRLTTREQAELWSRPLPLLPPEQLVPYPGMQIPQHVPVQNYGHGYQPVLNYGDRQDFRQPY